MQSLSMQRSVYWITSYVDWVLVSCAHLCGDRLLSIYTARCKHFTYLSFTTLMPDRLYYAASNAAPWSQSTVLMPFPLSQSRRKASCSLLASPPAECPAC